MHRLFNQNYLNFCLDLKTLKIKKKINESNMLKI